MHQEAIVRRGRRLAIEWWILELSVYLVIILSCTALPTAIPTSFTVSGLIFQLYEPFLAIAAVCVLARYRPSRYVFGRAWLIAASAGVSLAVGLLNGNSLQKIYQDVRLPVILVIGILVAGGVACTEMAPRCVRLLPYVLWISAAVLILASTSGFDISGRTESVVPSVDGAATRLISPATFLAVAVLCGFISLAVAQRSTLKSSLKFMLPAAAIVGLSFTRNHLVGLMVAVIFPIVALRSAAVMIGLFRLLAIATPVLLVCVVTLSALTPDNWLSQQATGYSARVLEGITARSLANDESTAYRSQETSRIIPVIEESPIIGHGMGAAYQPAEGPSGQFLYDRGPYYAHDFYLWLLLKTGVVGLALFLLAVLSPLWRALRAPNSGQLVAGACTAAFLTISFVTPLPLSTPEALLFGAVLGLLAAYSRDHASGGKRLTNWSATSDERV